MATKANFYIGREIGDRTWIGGIFLDGNPQAVDAVISGGFLGIRDREAYESSVKSIIEAAAPPSNSEIPDADYAYTFDEPGQVFASAYGGGWLPATDPRVAEEDDEDESWAHLEPMAFPQHSAGNIARAAAAIDDGRAETRRKTPSDSRAGQAVAAATPPPPPEKLEKLSPEQQLRLTAVHAEYMHDLTAPRPKVEDWGVNSPLRKAMDVWLAVIYGLYNAPVPARVEVVASPHAAIELARQLISKEHMPSSLNTDRCGTGDAGWVSAYDFFYRIGILTADEAAKVIALRDFGRAAWDTILLDECAIVVRRPLKIAIDDRGRPHDPKSQCLIWADGREAYAWHGVWVPKRMIADPKSYTRAEVEAITSTEQRRALCEINGWGWYAELLGATTIDTWTDPKTGLRYELMQYRSVERNGQVAKLLKKQSPRLQDGSQPWYVEPVHEDLKTAAGARRWQVPPVWTPAQCDADPVLTYSIET